MASNTQPDEEFDEVKDPGMIEMVETMSSESSTSFSEEGGPPKPVAEEVILEAPGEVIVVVGDTEIQEPTPRLRSSDVKFCRRRCVAVLIFLVIIAAGVTAAVIWGGKAPSSPPVTSVPTSAPTPSPTTSSPSSSPTIGCDVDDNGAHVRNHGCFLFAESNVTRPLSSSADDCFPRQCAKLCNTLFFAIKDRECLCFSDADLPTKNRLDLERCASMMDNKSNNGNGTDDDTGEVMDIFYHIKVDKTCDTIVSKTVQNVLVQEENTPFGWDMIRNTFHASPIKLYQDACGTNIYEIRTSISEELSSLKYSTANMEAYYASEITKSNSSLAIEAKAAAKFLNIGASFSYVRKQDQHLKEIAQSSGADSVDSFIASVTGVKRIAELDMGDFAKRTSFISLNDAFRSRLREYFASNFDRSIARGIFDQYGHSILRAGMIGGVYNSRITAIASKVEERGATVNEFVDCFDSQVSAEVNAFFASGGGGTDNKRCSSSLGAYSSALRDAFRKEVGEQNVIGGQLKTSSENNKEFVVTPTSATLLRDIEHYPANNSKGPVFQLITDVLTSSRLAPSEFHLLQMTEAEVDKLQDSLETHLVEYLKEASDDFDLCQSDVCASGDRVFLGGANEPRCQCTTLREPTPSPTKSPTPSPTPRPTPYPKQAQKSAIAATRGSQSIAYTAGGGGFSRKPGLMRFDYYVYGNAQGHREIGVMAGKNSLSSYSKGPSGRTFDFHLDADVAELPPGTLYRSYVKHGLIRYNKERVSTTLGNRYVPVLTGFRFYNYAVSKHGNGYIKANVGRNEGEIFIETKFGTDHSDDRRRSYSVKIEYALVPHKYWYSWHYSGRQYKSRGESKSFERAYGSTDPVSRMIMSGFSMQFFNSFGCGFGNFENCKWLNIKRLAAGVEDDPNSPLFTADARFNDDDDRDDEDFGWEVTGQQISLTPRW